VAPGPGRPPPNQKQNLTGALRTFRGLSLFALAVSLGIGAILLAKAVSDRQAIDRFLLANWAFWAIAVFSLVAGYGLGCKLVRALTHRQRWRHAMPWLAIILVALAASLGVGALIANYLGPGQPLYGPVAMAFGLVVSWIEFHRPGPSLDG
jgi:uncharacterized BrkB/YihY/UPF0761 family membrane protein